MNEVKRICSTCKHQGVIYGTPPCGAECLGEYNNNGNHSNWEPKEVKKVKETPWIEKFCHNCEHWTVYKADKPCVLCNDYEKWVRKAKEVKEAKDPEPNDLLTDKPEPKIPDNENWYKNFEIDKQLKVIRNEQNDFEVEVKAALSDMEKGLLRLQNRFDNLGKTEKIKPDPNKYCGNCEFSMEDVEDPPCYGCRIFLNWTPKDKTEGCECSD